MSKSAVQSRASYSASRKARLKIQKPESDNLKKYKSEPVDTSFGFFYKFLLVSSYILSALALCLAIAA